MSLCNDGKCPLNRQGITHETHETIENRHVKNLCNDPRCAMNRMGIKHDVHQGAEQKIQNTTRKRSQKNILKIKTVNKTLIHMNVQNVKVLLIESICGKILKI